jgi:hypothetical protein
LNLFFLIPEHFSSYFGKFFCANVEELPLFSIFKTVKTIKTKKMQIDMDSDIAYFEDPDTLRIINYKAGDYSPDDELNELFTKVYGEIHSTGGNVYLLEKSMDNVNTNNSRFIVGGSIGLQMLYAIRPHVYAYSPLERKIADIGKLLETHTN